MAIAFTLFDAAEELKMTNEINTAQIKHSKEFIDMAGDDSYCEQMYQPNGYGKNTGDCGDTVEIFLNVKRGMIKDVTFQIDGCVNTFVCANTIVQKIWGKRLETAWDITPELVSDYLKTLPEDHFHCAELAVGALYLALTDFKKRGF